MISKSMNDVAFKRGRHALSKQSRSKTVVRDKYFSSDRAVRVSRSTKRNLKVELKHFMDEYGLQQHGGAEKPKSKRLAVPNRDNLSAYMGVAFDQKIPKKVSIQTLMAKAPKSRRQKTLVVGGQKPFVLRSGVFIRVRTGRGGLEQLYAFTKDAEHTKKLIDYQLTIERTFNQSFERFFNVAYQRQLRR